ncbi:MAG: hypothetical protein HWN80_10530 [Candidatus Lokiarchaeota archaeon]|nr:hypothetical protein [Candidatus Lokiarchaeota archaeon]
MELSIYWIGMLLAILGGCSHYLGLILEKHVINKMPKEVKLMKSIIKEPLWLFAIFIRFGTGSILFIFAQIIIGPAITPGLMASGLIILAIGSIKILGEKLNYMEIVAIFIMIIAVTFIGLSGFSIEISEENLLNPNFLIRISLSTGILGLIAIVFQILQGKIPHLKAVLLALISGLMLSLNNFWITPFIWSLGNMFGGYFNIEAFLLFIVSSVLLIIANILGVIKMSQGFRSGRASFLATIQNVPVQLTPSILYFFVFMMIPSRIMPILFFILGVALIISSSFILEKRQTQIEQIS